MSGTQEQGSEVARLLARIQEEYEAAQRGVSGLAQGTSQHVFITHRMENMGILQGELESIVGKDTSMELIINQLNTIPDTNRLVQ